MVQVEITTYFLRRPRRWAFRLRPSAFFCACSWVKCPVLLVPQAIEPVAVALLSAGPGGHLKDVLDSG